MSLSEQDRDDLDEALWGGRIYDDVPTVVAVIVARHVAAALEQAADAIDQRIAKNIGGHPFSDHDRGLAEAKRIVRAQIHN